MARLRGKGVALDKPVAIRHLIWGNDEERGKVAVAAAKEAGFSSARIEKITDDGDPYFVIKLSSKITLKNLAAVFNASAAAEELAHTQGFRYSHWTVDELWR